MDPHGNDIMAIVLGKIPSGCSILTAAHHGHSSGMLASWIQQAAFEPLLLTVAVRDGRPIQPLIEGSRRLVLNLLGSNQRPMFKHFGGGFGPGDEAFAGLDIQESAYGVILPECLGYLGCDLVSQLPAGDHHVYLAQPRVAGMLSGGEPYVHTRKSAAGY